MPTIVCLGDSITAGYPYSPKESWVSICRDQLNINLINAGISNDTTADLLRRFEQDVVPHKPQAVLLLAGTNDAWQGIPLAVTTANFWHLVRSVQQIKAQPIMGLIPPIINKKVEDYYNMDNVVQFNLGLHNIRNWIKEFTKKKDIPLVDFYSYLCLMDTDQGQDQLFYDDGGHPNTLGYKKIAENLAPQISLLVKKCNFKT